MRRKGNYNRGCQKRRRGPGIWNGKFMKMIAIAAMLMDHVAVVILEQGIIAVCQGDAAIINEFFASDIGARVLLADRVLRGIGRVSFPIVCFLLTEGFLHSGNRRKYIIRIGSCALISEVFFDLAVYDSWFYLGYQNVLFTLFVALLVLTGMRRFNRRPVLQIICIAAGSGVSWLIHSDYYIIGIILPAVFYWFRNEILFQMMIGGILSIIESISFFGSAILAYIPIMMYNGKRGYWNLKYFFYVFFPLQFLALYLIRQVLLKGGWLTGLITQAGL